MNHALKTAPVSLRAAPARGLASEASVSTKDGDYGAGIIYGAAIVTRGEALGHEFWCDGVFLQQVNDALNATPRGIKSRLAHPGLSSDGVGKVLGRFRDSFVDGDIVRADLHFVRTAHSSPGGDIAGYVMGLAAEDPELFGTSIVFEPDAAAEEVFWSENIDEDGEFVSPDPQNERNLRHARLGKLWASDVVDEPAANPGGMFSRGQELAYEANALAEYMLGLTDTSPLIEELGIDPLRARQFWNRFLDTHEGVLVTIYKEPTMANSATRNDAQGVQVDADALRAEGAKNERERFAALAKAFDNSAFVAEMFDAGKSPSEAKPMWLERENERLTAQVDLLEAMLEIEDEEDEEDEEMEGEPADEEKCEGEPEDEEEMTEGEEMPKEEEPKATRKQNRPARFSAKASGTSSPDFISVAAEYAVAHKCSIGDAQSHVARTQPALFAAYKTSLRPVK